MSETPTKQVYEVYIKTSKEKLWAALLDPEQTEKFYMNMRVASDFKKGDAIAYVFHSPEGNDTRVTGTVLEVEPCRRLSHTFKAHVEMVDKDAPDTRVTYELEELGAVVKLTVTHDGFAPGMDATFGATSAGWPMILNGLKTWLETGESLGLPPMG